MRECKLDNSPIVYYVSGREHAQWVLFLHAAFVDHRMFKAQLDYFQGKYNVLTLDLIGHGKSTHARRGESIKDMPGWIGAILEKEGIQKIHVVGISLGAVLAQAFAAQFPGSVQSLACFGGYDITVFDPKAQQENGAAQRRMMLRAIFSVKWFAQANKEISAYTPQAQEEFYALNLAFPKKSFRYLASLGALVGTAPAAERGYPLLIGCGEHDLPSEHTVLEQWRAREPACQVAVFPGAGHCVNMDVPQPFNEALERFWAGARPVA